MKIKLNQELGYTLVNNEILLDLIDSENMLIALENAGVDNWDGYDFAKELYEEMQKEDDN